MKNVLIASDHVMLGTMGMRAMTPYFEAAGYRVAELPTGLVSNNFGYGKYALKEETTFLAESLANWQTLGFCFDALLTGFIFSHEQVDILKNYGQKEKLIWVHDPIMGDYGDFYKGMNPLIAQWHLEMAKSAYLCMPNLTEAQLLLGQKVRLVLTKQEKIDLLKALYAATGNNWVVTSVTGEKDHIGEIWFSDQGQIEMMSYERLAQNMVGTGDMFASFYTMKFLKDHDVQSAALFAKDAVKALLGTLEEDAGMLGIIPHQGVMQILKAYL